MTRLPSDSFLSSGAMDADFQLSLAGLAGNNPPSSVISPLSLPGGVQYFDTISHSRMTSHPNGVDSRDPPQAQPAGFLSPHLTPIPSHAQYRLQFQRQSQQRAASLSPTRGPTGRRRDGRMGGKNQTDVDLVSGIQIPVNTISGTGSGLITVRRPAPRTYSSTDSVTSDSHVSAAEHEYRRIEKLRQAFDDERRLLQASRDRAEEVYKDIIEELEREHTRQRSQWDADKYELQTQIMQLQSRLKDVESHANGTQDLKLGAFQHRSSSQTSPTAHPGLPHLILHDSNFNDMPAIMEYEQPSKVIDVQEYHKDLEGIHLKENAVKKETFTDTPSSAGSKTSSGKTSPSEDLKASARERSIQVLKAPAQSRLTMHAGHTPTVSLSITHTGASNTVVSSGSNTPTLMSGDGAMSSDENNVEPYELVEPIHMGMDDYHGPAIMEPSDEDPELKGPLSLRNIPAKDEVFLRRVSDKLEQALSGGDATPTVLQGTEEGDNEIIETNGQADEEDNDAGSAEGVEEDIPLKLRKSSSNFGKPFGVA